jgi:hypothetical protein
MTQQHLRIRATPSWLALCDLAVALAARSVRTVLRAAAGGRGTSLHATPLHST